MFARKVKNRSGSISIQVIRKERGKYRVVQTVGTSKDPDEIERLWQQAQSLAKHADPNQPILFAMQTPGDQVVQNAMESLSNASLRTIGPELIFGTLFERIGFNQIPDERFRHLVIARLAYPVSKLKTTDYLYRYQGMKWSVSAVYKFPDRLHSRYKQQAETIAFLHTQKRRGQISVVFYDMTTLYFEAEEEDDWRRIGFSKDGKFEHPQILLGLLVAEEGLPIGYDLFEGNTFEGHTVLPLLRAIQEKYELDPPVVVADAAMLSKTVLAKLMSAQYQFILGARIKNESATIKQQILEKAGGKREGECWVLERPDGTRLIVSYSEKRARKDARNRQRGLLRLQKGVSDFQDGFANSADLSLPETTNRGPCLYRVCCVCHLHGIGNAAETENIAMSAKRAGELSQTMYELHYTLPDSKEAMRFILNMNSEQLSFHKAVHEIQGVASAKSGEYMKRRENFLNQIPLRRNHIHAINWTRIKKKRGELN
ncbi:MAG: IS1634 family transposase [Candidatus Omnitrophota bacterium]|jgi:hypothetical protein|nr:MAG: IS1634 family transposase [Candidatus Omnitrophota bacterium]